MEVFLKKIIKIEQDYLSKSKYLKKLKHGAIGLGVMMVAYGALEVIKSQYKYKLTTLEVEFIVLLIAAVIMPPIIAAPLFKLFSSKKLREINWTIKSSIFSPGLSKYTNDYRFQFDKTLPEKDLRNLKFMENQLSSYRGNDLIFGEIKGIKFGISDIHAYTLRDRKFDGLVGVLYFKDFDKAQSFYDCIVKKTPSNAEVKIVEKRVYVLFKGDREHFEIEFSKEGINKEKLISDFNFFNSFVDLFFRDI